MNITEQTRNQLHTYRGEWPVIAKTAGLSYWWLLKFAQGQIKSPSANRLETLRNGLHRHATRKVAALQAEIRKHSAVNEINAPKEAA